MLSWVLVQVLVFRGSDYPSSSISTAWYHVVISLSYTTVVIYSDDVEYNQAFKLVHPKRIVPTYKHQGYWFDLLAVDDGRRA